MVQSARTGSHADDRTFGATVIDRASRPPGLEAIRYQRLRTISHVTGLEFAWRLIDVLVWPVVVLTALVIYRRLITTTFSGAMSGRKLKKLKAGSFEVEWEAKLDEAGRNVAQVLAETPGAPTESDQIPTNLVDLIPLTTASPRYGVRAAFHQVQRALTRAYPQLVSAPPEQLSDAMRNLARQGVMDIQVERAVIQLSQLLESSNSDLVTPAYAYQFLSLAEGAIHAILRSAGNTTSGERPAQQVPAPEWPLRWMGVYNNDYPIGSR